MHELSDAADVEIIRSCAAPCTDHHPLDLDPSIWNSLPAELLERVFACLPLASLFKFRAVSRSWKAAPLQPLFRSLRACVMIPETWFIMLGRPRAAAQSRSTSALRAAPPSSLIAFALNLELSKAVALRNAFLPFPPATFGCISYCATAGGLMCYHYHMGFSTAQINHEMTSVSLWVGNPFTKEWKCLPPMIGTFPLNFPLRGLAGMVILDSTAVQHRGVHYKIIVRTHSRCAAWGSGMMTEEYDSHTNAWKVTATGNVPSDHRIEQVLHCRGSLYFLTWQMRDGIYVYHLTKQSWSRILPPKRYQFTSPHMVECCGQLILVSGVGTHHTVNKRKGRAVRRLHVRTTGIKIWQLVQQEKDPSCTLNSFSAAPTTTSTTVDDQTVPLTIMSARSNWSSLSWMPEELVQEFVTGVHFHCTSIRNLIYLTNSISMLTFNVVARMWQRVIITQPPAPLVLQDFVSFVPKLEASP
ncbi:hypothetical protein L7F22_005496 [Adiantum nelumboides]|nr:hypothetical protein [Adiantum nelumboides]